ncbi:MAG TPA: RNA polymerase sigma factor [Longimicrobiales bacterium]|nr:RNA polymerase sigma factor [Longimicrobiales bacterium]
MDAQRWARDVPDRELARRVERDGDEAAFLALYERHTPRIYQSVLRLSGYLEHEAEDVVQETWMQAVRGLREFRWEAQFSTWLTTIAVRCCSHRWRREGREVQLPEALAAASVPAAPFAGRIDLQQALARLPESNRAVLLLHDVEGYRHHEIAELLGIAVGTSKAQLFRARRQMRAWLDGPAAPAEGVET